MVFWYISSCPTLNGIIRQECLFPAAPLLLIGTQQRLAGCWQTGLSAVALGSNAGGLFVLLLLLFPICAQFCLQKELLLFN